MKKLIFLVSNDLNYDQRMIRICTSLQNHGFDVLLLGFSKKSSKDLNQQSFTQKRLPLIFQKGKLFYLEIQIRLFFYLLFNSREIICAIDMDTLLPASLISSLKGKTLVYDAHEYYSETSGLVGRHREKGIWQKLENYLIPKLKYAYAVNDSLAGIFKKKFKVDFQTIKNVPVLKENQNVLDSGGDYFLYQGALNKGRGLMEILEAFKSNEYKLKIAGSGPLEMNLKDYIEQNNLGDRIELLGWLEPAELQKVTSRALMGLNILDGNGLSYYYSLANKFFDYIHAEIPQICMNFPEYKRVNEHFEVAILLDQIDELNTVLNKVISNNSKMTAMIEECKKAKLELNWQVEERKLLDFYDRLASNK